jgi:glycerol uptake facilitator-like aquaporin
VSEPREQISTARKLVAEFLGTALLVAAVVGSGIMAQMLTRTPAIQLLCNSVATGGALVAILLVFGPISGAHLNPAVTVTMAATRDLSWRLAAGYIAVQLAGGVAGAVLANVMFDHNPIEIATNVREGFPLVFSEGVATFGLIGVVVAVGRTRPSIAPLAVAAYIVAAYWFTSSTSFANPAVTLGRVFSDSFAGIRPSSVPMFVVAQAIGAACGGLVFTWLVPLQRATKSASERAARS